MYTTTGIYADTLTAANGCDSIVDLDLTVNIEIVTNLTENDLLRKIVSLLVQVSTILLVFMQTP